MTLDSVASNKLAFKLNTKEELVQQVHHKVKQSIQKWQTLKFCHHILRFTFAALCLNCEAPFRSSSDDKKKECSVSFCLTFTVQQKGESGNIIN